MDIARVHHEVHPCGVKSLVDSDMVRIGLGVLGAEISWIWRIYKNNCYLCG